MNGVVKSYDVRRGMGELTPDNGGADVPVYVSEVERAGLTKLTPGERFSFGIQTDKMRKRSFAVKLEILS